MRAAIALGSAKRAARTGGDETAITLLAPSGDTDTTGQECAPTLTA